jgi:hypothetical protein
MKKLFIKLLLSLVLISNYCFASEINCNSWNYVTTNCPTGVPYPIVKLVTDGSGGLCTSANWSVIGTNIQVRAGCRGTFSIANGVAPPAPPATWGANFSGANNTAFDVVAHPLLLSAMQQLNQTWARLWWERATQLSQGDSYWNVSRNFAKAGIKVMLMQQFDTPGASTKMFTDADAIARANSIPANSGISAVSWNEVDYSFYYTGTQAQLVHMLSIVAPIYRAKGIQVIAPSFLDNLSDAQNFASIGGYTNVDAADAHCYYGKISDLSCITNFIGFIASYNKAHSTALKPFISEFGVRGYNLTQAAQWASDTGTLLGQLKALNGTFMPFPELPQTNGNDPLDQAMPLNSSYGPNAPFWAAFLGAIGK